MFGGNVGKENQHVKCRRRCRVILVLNIFVLVGEKKLVINTVRSYVFAIIEENIPYPWEMLSALCIVTFCCGTLPTKLVPKIPHAKNSIHHQLEIVTGCRITMQVDTACWLQNTV